MIRHFYHGAKAIGIQQKLCLELRIWIFSWDGGMSTVLSCAAGQWLHAEASVSHRAEDKATGASVLGCHAGKFDG
jgi:hypothetical protein